ncbi:BQ5605_C006g04068 [Microbotryum silenes-dioicae]|uniref:BQ5605_C006g04068 protein n=1 Tax=Microbotryum silenes-dioicae TaxID=796604 RepID=A0A2X0MT19_9BASI|nr:BQ5605_C006g04068 [Microbotryum silenes-dioicae]
MSLSFVRRSSITVPSFFNRTTHTSGCHRDVSSGIVMVDRHGDKILIDYNLAVKKARTVEEECRLSRSVHSHTLGFGG